ncbi:hypothetical protein MMC22_000479 [Lobaria immixta]|nr:hypothetical protein [Lobaria immixta]
MADSNDHAATSPEPVKGLPDPDAPTSSRTVEGPAPSIAALPALVNEAEDSTFGDEESYTTSIESSITAYKYEHGRRYHAYRAGQYNLPNDEQEQDREV